MKFKKSTYISFLLPVFLLFAMFFIVPFLIGFGYSFIEWNGVGTQKVFVGLENYRMLLSDAKYIQSLKFSSIYVVAYVVLGNTIALILALLVDRKIKGRNIFRAIFFMPNVISPIIAGFIWIFIFQTVTKSLYQLTSLELFTKSWLGDPSLATVSMIIVGVWQTVGYLMVIYLSALQGVDKSLVEASSIDGANSFMTFRHVVFPLIMPAVTVNLFMSTTQAFRVFDLNIALTNGGPGYATTSVALDIYKTAYNNNMMGYGSAKAIVLFLIVLTVIIFQTRFTRSKEVEA